MQRPEFVIPWVQMRAAEEYMIKAAKQYPVLEPFAPRHSITYFNNNKVDSSKSAYERLHSNVYDPKKPRCDRTDPRLYWQEIFEENKHHKVAMTSSLWHGRPNRVQVDFPEKKFNRMNKMRELQSRKYFLIDEDEGKLEVC